MHDMHRSALQRGALFRASWVPLEVVLSCVLKSQYLFRIQL